MSGDQRLLQALSDGKFHSHENLYRELGVMVHSRAASLRKKGHVIHVRREWSKSQRRNFWFYRLDPSSRAAPATCVGARHVGAARDEGTSSPQRTPDPRLAHDPLGPVAVLSTMTEPVRPPAPPLSLFDMPEVPRWA